jgi:murein L,D-transpeptidase YcbB/YkuD
MTLRKARLILGAAALAIAGPVMSGAQVDAAEAVEAVRPGIDFLFIDPEIRQVIERPREHEEALQRVSLGPDITPEAMLPQAGVPNPVFAALSNGLEQYKSEWGSLPAIEIPAGPAMAMGARGERVELLRARLGLPADGVYDQVVVDRIKKYQRIHALGADGVAGNSTIASLNLGPDHYLHRISVNLERASRLPAPGDFDRYVMVDAGNAEAYLFERDLVSDRMRVVVGAAESQTPLLAVMMRNAKANPYWNVPADMIRTMIAARVLRQGVGYLQRGRYEVLSDWTDAGRVLDPTEVDWKQVAEGNSDIHVRQLPGPGNAMGEMKFETPNRFGIYLHDTPTKQLFRQADRWRSNGCVRLEDYRRFTTWVFDRPPQPGSAVEQTFDLERPVPVFITYLTIEASDGGVVFRDDPYALDVVTPTVPVADTPTLAAASL